MVAVVDPIESTDQALAMTPALHQSRGPPGAVTAKLDLVELEYIGPRVGKRMELYPAPDTKDPDDLADDDPRVPFRGHGRTIRQAASLRSPLIRPATRSDGCAPWPIQ